MAQDEPLLDRIVGSVLGTVSFVLQRLLVHSLALLTAFVLVGPVLGGPLSMIGLKISIYAGIICLLPSGPMGHPYWWIPVLSGCLQGMILFVLQVFWPLIFLWAGLQTWAMRLVLARGSIGWDWTAAPVLLFGCFSTLSFVDAWNLPLWPFASFPALLLAGALVYRLYTRVCHTSLHRQMLAASLVRLRAVLQTGKLAVTEERQVRLLLSQCESAAVQNLLDEAMIDRIEGVSSLLEDMVRKMDSKSILCRNLFKSSQWKSLSRSAGARGGQSQDEIMQAVEELNRILAGLLAQRTASEEKPASTEEENRMDAHAGSARELLAKKPGLPPELARPVESIGFLTLEMLEAMKADPKDRLPGLRFLDRYLPKVHHIVDESRRMVDISGPETLARSVEVLQRLANAFADEKNGMLRNDTIDYTAELDALDTLLKMRGY